MLLMFFRRRCHAFHSALSMVVYRTTCVPARRLFSAATQTYLSYLSTIAPRDCGTLLWRKLLLPPKWLLKPMTTVVCMISPLYSLCFDWGEVGDIKVIERFFDLPLDYAEPDGQKIRVFARNLIPKDKAKTLEEEAKLPYCKFVSFFHSITPADYLSSVVYLQGWYLHTERPVQLLKLGLRWPWIRGRTSR